MNCLDVTNRMRWLCAVMSIYTLLESWRGAIALVEWCLFSLRHLTHLDPSIDDVTFLYIALDISRKDYALLESSLF